MKAGTFFRLAWFGAKTILLRQEKPILGTIILTDKCNLKCRHCSVNNISSVTGKSGTKWSSFTPWGCASCSSAEEKHSCGATQGARCGIW